MAISFGLESHIFGMKPELFWTIIPNDVRRPSKGWTCLDVLRDVAVNVCGGRCCAWRVVSAQRVLWCVGCAVGFWEVVVAFKLSSCLLIVMWHVTVGVLDFWQRNFTRLLAEVSGKGDCYGQDSTTKNQVLLCSCTILSRTGHSQRGGLFKHGDELWKAW